MNIICKIIQRPFGVFFYGGDCMGLMGFLKKKAGEVMDGAEEKKREKEEKKKQEEKIRKWQDKFETALGNYDTALMDDRELMYLGKRNTDPDINNPSRDRKKANNVINIIYEFIESQIDTTIPNPTVESKRKDFETQAQIIENSIKNDLKESDIYRINDENERTTPIQGFSIITVNWNPDYKHHLYRGEIEIENRHPKTLIPQPGVHDIQKMDYFFILSSESKGYVKKRYGKDVETESEEYPGINSLEGQDNPDNHNNKVTVITAWYRDEDGDVSKYTWCADVELEDLPKYFYRRDSQGNIMEYETLDRDIIRNELEPIPAMSPVIDDMGQPIFYELGQPMLEPTRIRYFVPNIYPVVIRRNVPIAFNFGGQSDVDVIRDQADAIKKVVTRIEKKILDSGAIIKMPNDDNVSMTTQGLYTIIKGERQDLSLIDMKELQPSIQQDIVFAQDQYKAAQNTLGITDSFQGKPDPTAQSGVAKQIQVQQATGRMQSKLFNKKRAFKELFEIIFEFKLAFYDELRPYMARGNNNAPIYGEFNKYDFLMKDEAGEWYYNTDFIFSADAGDGLPRDKVWLMEQARADASANLMDKVDYWTIMEKLGFPGASEIKDKAILEQQQLQLQQQQLQAQQAQAQQLQQIQQQL